MEDQEFSDPDKLILADFSAPVQPLPNKIP